MFYAGVPEKHTAHELPNSLEVVPPMVSLFLERFCKGESDLDMRLVERIWEVGFSILALGAFLRTGAKEAVKRMSFARLDMHCGGYIV